MKKIGRPIKIMPVVFFAMYLSRANDRIVVAGANSISSGSTGILYGIQVCYSVQALPPDVIFSG